MRKIFLAAMVSAAAALLSTQAFADPVERLLSRGKDGDYSYYQVRCKNGTVGTVVVQEKQNNVCAQAFGGGRVCDAGWNVQRAAEHACR